MSLELLRDVEAERRYATLIALALDIDATLTDQILEQHDLFMGRLLAEARRKHEQRFIDARKAINDKCDCIRRLAMRWSRPARKMFADSVAVRMGPERLRRISEDV
jgi:hypothetical protein